MSQLSQAFKRFMLSRWRNGVAVTVLSVYVLTGALLEIAHHDDTSILLQSRPSLTSHDCGEREIHLSPDKKHDCLACTQSSQQVATEASHQVGIVPSPVRVTCIPAPHEPAPATDIIHSGKRGPPHS